MPSAIPETRKTYGEKILVRHAKSQDAPFVTSIGKGIADHLNPDRPFDENDRARRRGITLGPQGPDGMSRINGWIDPETRGYLEAANAAVRPGRHQPNTHLRPNPTASPTPRPTPTSTTEPNSESDSDDHDSEPNSESAPTTRVR